MISPDVVRQTFKKLSESVEKTGENFSAWTNDKIVVTLNENKGKVWSIYSLLQKRYTYTEELSLNSGLNVLVVGEGSVTWDIGNGCNEKEETQ